MRFSRATILAAMVLVGAVLASSVEGQGAPDSLKNDFGKLLTTAGSAPKFINSTTTPTAGKCLMIQGQATTVPPLALPWAFKLPGNNTAQMWHLETAFSLTIKWVPATDGTPMATTGLNITATVKGDGMQEGPGAAYATEIPSAPPGNVPATSKIDWKFDATRTYISHGGGPLTVTITVTPKPAGPAAVNNIAIECGTGTFVEPLVIYSGMPGQGDVDADGIPNEDDPDIDNDGVANAAERAVRCNVTGENVKFEENKDLKPGKNDFDKDGSDDEVECAKGTNPLSSSSVPAKPKTIMDYLPMIIVLLVILLLVAAVLLFFFKFSVVAKVSVASQPELFIPPGEKGKYEVAVESTVKKGEPRTFQLQVSGMPEGWDAKLNIDHVTLPAMDQPNARQTVWLEVEAPQHTDAESAVVAVKAVPLNKAGRKDTMHRGGKAETITSINVPPGSKVPVKRGGAVKAAAPKDAAPAASAPSDVGTGDADQQPVMAIEGVGEVYGKALEKMGIRTVGELRRASVGEMAVKTGANETTVRQWQAMGDLMNLEGVGPQFAEQLVRSGVTSIPQLAEQKPKELVAAVEKTNAARQTPIQGAGIQEKQAKNFVKAAKDFLKKNPQAVPAAAPVAAMAASAPAAAPMAAAAPASAPAAKPQLQVGGLKHEPPAFRQGEQVKSTVNVANNGAATSTIKLTLYVNDGLADVQTVTVKAGKAKDVQFKWTAQERNKLNIRGELVPQ